MQAAGSTSPPPPPSQPPSDAPELEINSDELAALHAQLDAESSAFDSEGSPPGPARDVSATEIARRLEGGPDGALRGGHDAEGSGDAWMEVDSDESVLSDDACAMDSDSADRQPPAIAPGT